MHTLAHGEAHDAFSSSPLTDADIPEHVSPDMRALLMQYKDVFGYPKGLPPDRGIAHVIPEVEGARP
eukprot:142749-Chlamydomonas_euryale.AAC.1